MHMAGTVLAVLAGCGVSVAAGAALSVPSVFSDGMVLQVYDEGNDVALSRCGCAVRQDSYQCLLVVCVVECPGRH